MKTTKIMELKAQVYDLIVEREKLQGRVQQINQIIREKTAEIDKLEKKEEKEEI